MQALGSSDCTSDKNLQTHQTVQAYQFFVFQQLGDTDKTHSCQQHELMKIPIVRVEVKIAALTSK